MTLEISQLSVTSGARLSVTDISLSVKPGQATAILGANGAGKSEIVLGIAGMLPISGGSVIVDGTDISGAAPEMVRAAGVAAVPEGHRVLTQLTVDENLRAAGSLATRRLGETLNSTYGRFPELGERKSQIAGTLSGGQQQMVALAHALMSRPRYLLIDEMSLGLAPLIVKRLMGVVEELKASGTGIVLIEQFTDLALSISEEALVIRAGAIRYSGAARSLLDNPALLNDAYFGARHADGIEHRTQPSA